MELINRALRIGGACGFWGDANLATESLLVDKKLDFLVYDYLAEITLAIMARAKQKDSSLGYATDFVSEVMEKNLKLICSRKIRVISNAGGVNPLACARAVEGLIKKFGLELKVGVVTGDNLLDRLPELVDGGIREMFSGESFPKKDLVTSINAYLGAFPIAALLDQGADIVVTGRCVDSAVTLGACISHFNWKETDLNLLASGSLVGHLIECGTQVTGGNFTDWEINDGGFQKIGYPIAEVSSDGTATICKPEGTGGVINFGTVAEQLVYEIEDPSNYILPDVICDFSNVKIVEQGLNEVKVSGAKGYRPTPHFKVCLTYLNGYRGGQLFAFYGENAVKKAKAYSSAVLARAKEDLLKQNMDDFLEISTEILGSETQFGFAGEGENNREVLVKIAAKHTFATGIKVMLKAASGLSLSAPPGLSGFAGTRPKPSPILALFSFLISKETVPISIQINHSAKEHLSSPQLKFKRDERIDIEVPSYDVGPGSMVLVPLIALAYARSGDKGDRVNIGVISRSLELYPFLWSVLTENEVKNMFSHFVMGKVRRFPIPGFSAINFLLESALGGGGTSSLRNDPQGKGFSQILLSKKVLVPKRLVPVNWLTQKSPD